VPGRTVTISEDVPKLALPSGLQAGIDGFSLHGDVLVPPSVFGEAVPVATLLIGTDGSAGTIEAVRAALGALPTVFPPVTAEEAVRLARSTTDGYARAALIGTLIVVLVGGISLAVTTVDGFESDAGRTLHLSRWACRYDCCAAPCCCKRLFRCCSTWAWPSCRRRRVVALPHLAADSEGTRPGTALARLPHRRCGCRSRALLATVLALPFVNSASRPEALRSE
jgi:hypothetical protein